MPSTYTTRNRAEKQADGENANTWGSRANSNTFDMFDEALDGVESFALSGSKTLTTSDGASDEARNRVLNISSGSGGTITIPNVEKVYLVRNGSSGDVIVTTGSGTTATVKSGNVQWVYSEGGNVVRAAYVTDFAANNLVTTGTLAAGATTLSGALTYGGVTLSNSVTGTGSMVLSASPTFTGTLSGSAASFSSTLAAGNTTITGTVSVSSTLSVTGTSTLSTTNLAANGIPLKINSSNGNANHIQFQGSGTTHGYIGVNATNVLQVLDGAAAAVLTCSATAFSCPSSTTASAANLYQASDKSALLRSTSSLRYKQDVLDLSDADADKVLSLRPVTYRSKAEADDPTRIHWGFIAEEADSILPQLVHYVNGEPDGFQYERVIVGLLSVVRRLEARVSTLETAAGIV